MVEVYGVLACGRRDCQSSGISLPSLLSSSMSPARARVTTSARRPSITARACLPEPPWDCWMVTASWPRACQCLLKEVLNSLYSSRVGS
ncbi:hypothetical protein D3C85_374400 [compost metagenome]